MKHQMGLQTKYFNCIKTGTKRIELRLYDDKRRQIKIGDTIEFSESGNKNNKFEAKVLGLLRYASFKDLFEDFDISVLADASMTKQELLAGLEQFFTPEKQAELGVLGIKIEPIK